MTEEDMLSVYGSLNELQDASRQLDYLISSGADELKQLDVLADIANYANEFMMFANQKYQNIADNHLPEH